MTVVTLYVFWLNDEQQQLIDAQVKTQDDLVLDESCVKEQTFYNIDFVRPYNDRFCEVGVSGDVFLVNEDVKTVRRKIESRFSIGLN